MPKKDFVINPIPTVEQAQALIELPHRVQSAIAFLQGHYFSQGQRFPQLEPKHLRVGVNSCMVETSGLARLLVSKEIITAAEYFDSIIAMWEEEVDSYRARIKEINPKLEI